MLSAFTSRLLTRAMPPQQSVDRGSACGSEYSPEPTPEPQSMSPRPLIYTDAVRRGPLGHVPKVRPYWRAGYERRNRGWPDCVA